MTTVNTADISLYFCKCPATVTRLRYDRAFMFGGCISQKLRLRRWERRQVVTERYTWKHEDHRVPNCYEYTRSSHEPVFRTDTPIRLCAMETTASWVLKRARDHTRPALCTRTTRTLRGWALGGGRGAAARCAPRCALVSAGDLTAAGTSFEHRVTISGWCCCKLEPLQGRLRVHSCIARHAQRPTPSQRSSALSLSRAAGLVGSRDVLEVALHVALAAAAVLDK